MSGSITSPEEIVARIKAWDGRDVHVLTGRLAELREALAEEGVEQTSDELIDYTSLPFGERVPDHVANYPVWTVDAAGMALVGDIADEVEPLADVVRWYEDKATGQKEARQ